MHHTPIAGHLNALIGKKVGLPTSTVWVAPLSMLSTRRYRFGSGAHAPAAAEEAAGRAEGKTPTDTMTPPPGRRPAVETARLSSRFGAAPLSQAVGP